LSGVEILFSKFSMWLCIIGILIFILQLLVGYYGFIFYTGITIYCLGFAIGIAAFAKKEKSKTKYVSVISFVLIPFAFYYFFLLLAYQIGEK